jgi:Protein of unknown function (DUF2478)
MSAALMSTPCCCRLAPDLRVGGLVQSSWTDRSCCPSSHHVNDLRTGESFNIWDARGACARGCRLDERGLIDIEPNRALSPIVSTSWSSTVSARQRAWGAAFSASLRRPSTRASLCLLQFAIPTSKLWNSSMVHALSATADAVANYYMGAEIPSRPSWRSAASACPDIHKTVARALLSILHEA